MSTYLVAYVIGNYDYVEKTETENNTLVRVYTPVGKSKLGEFSLDVSFYLIKLRI
jgi:puromycin-sensitive aminopeptidase